ncbi:hypothetical protein MFKK_24660 [Halopseudomonas aestusnigri]|nr:hypothetical protein MFKK_24660 [Halopseudomonas aestusnigri]
MIERGTEHEEAERLSPSVSMPREVVTDAGTVGRADCREVRGYWGEVYPCPRLSRLVKKRCGPNCELCGGTGLRKVCNQTACHEYGCNGGVHCYAPPPASEPTKAKRKRTISERFWRWMRKEEAL